MKFGLLFLLFVPLFAACSAYHPLKQGVGFTDAPAGDDSALVTYTGDSSPEESHKFALLRAAELAALRGTPYFLITSEHLYVTNISDRFRPAESSYGTFSNNGPTTVHGSNSAYTRNYTLSEAQIQVKFAAAPGPTTIPAAFLLRQARSENISLSPGVEAKLAALPEVTGEVKIPTPPPPSAKPLIAPVTQPAATKTGG